MGLSKWQLKQKELSGTKHVLYVWDGIIKEIS
jgi:hypothetical protein